MSGNVAISVKDELRAQLKRARVQRSPEERTATDAAIAARVVALPAFRAAPLVATYLSFGAEVETRGVIEAARAAGKVVALPRCVPDTRRMRWYAVCTPDELAHLGRSSFGVLEPAEDPAREVDLTCCPDAVALVPGLAFDLHGHRLGYGGGFYDTFLAAFPGASIGLCREAQLVASLAAQGAVGEHDVPVDVVATEARVIDPARSG